MLTRPEYIVSVLSIVELYDLTLGGSMSAVTGSVEISRPPEAVFAYVAAAANGKPPSRTSRYRPLT